MKDPYNIGGIYHDKIDRSEWKTESQELRQRLYGQRPGKINLEADPAYARLFIVEDLSRDISDYLWYKTKDPWVELPDLPHIVAERNYYNVRYMSVRYFETEKAIEDRKEQLGHFNVLRRLEEDLSWHVRELKKPNGPTVGVLRSKTALWIRKNKTAGEGVIRILVVDPELSAGYPLWGGPRNLRPCPSKNEDIPQLKHPQSLFVELCHYAKIMTPEEVGFIAEVPRTLGLPILSLVAAEWMSVVSYIITGLTNIEWELEHPYYRKDSDGLTGLLDRLHPLRRLIPVYRMMICETLNTILNKDSLPKANDNPASTHLGKLRSDFEAILQSIEQPQTRTQNIISLATTIIGVEENQRAMKMNKNLVRVTYLAVIFAPMAFISSFFSMTPDLATLKQTIWIYFAVAVPVTVTCLIIADHDRLLQHGKRFLGIENKEKRNEEGNEKK
ncbi:hypothetical protein HYFRA_00003192 [Hymenoscyphus fraxineus]|uniref:Uncharacterized protein n=1 Tax=Hymenoscyphus fraxineus TaxID=746836 RepID=A0A9N9PT05_9HELO|nr:hypothetical protein HYFRA_00003192 [Hymenoscyphus fraxineus]